MGAAAGLSLAGCSTGGAPVAARQSTPSTADVSRPLQDFVVAVELLSPNLEAEHHRTLVSALDHLAAALRDIAPGDDRSMRHADRIRAFARAVEGAETGTERDGHAVRLALEEASAAVRDLAKTDAARAEAERAARSAGQVDPGRPVSAQGAIVRQALAAVANGLLETLGADPVVREASKEPRQGKDAGPPPSGPLERASDAVVAMSREDWGRARSEAADALDALADAIGAADPARAGRVHSSAERVRAAGALAAGATTEVRSALIDAIDALADRGHSDGDVVLWIERARAAAVAIDPRTTFVFQRAPLQEAFRSVVDAYLRAGAGS